MRFFVVGFFLLLSAFVLADDQSPLTNFSSLRWDHRIVVINELERVADTARAFNANITEVNDRDIVWFAFQKSHVATNYNGSLSKSLLVNIRKTYGIESGKVVLIGKDGDVKFQSTLVNLESIFSAIDAMPMRQYEMQQ